MNLIQQLAEYQNAPLPTLEAAKKGANPNVSPWVAGAILSDRLEKQKRMAMGQGAAQGPMPTVDEQQDQEVAGIMGALNAQQAQPAQAAPAQQEPVMAASGGLMDAPVDPGMFDFCGGGIIAFDEGGGVDDAVYDPVTGALISGGETRRGENQTVREALGIGNVENRRALERAEEEARKASAPKPRPASNLSAGEKDKQSEYARLTKAGVPPELAAQLAGMSPAAKPAAPAVAKPPAAAPAGAGITAALGPVQKALTNAPEWATLEEARKREFEAPDMAKTPGELAAEREAHLKAQGITKKPWDLAAEQTAELRKIMGQETADRAAKREADLGRPTYRRIIENMGAGSFGQSGAAGTRANRKYQDEMDAEDQRLKELNYNRMMKLNEIDAKAQELRYNEATGDVAAAQKNRQEIAKLKREAQKDQAAVAQVQATQRQLAAAHDAQNATTLAAARERMGASGALTPKQIADIRDKAYDNINNKVKAGGVPLQMAMKKDPQMFERMVQEETNRLLATYTGGTMPAPSATGAGGKSPTGWGKAQVVK